VEGGRLLNSLIIAIILGIIMSIYKKSKMTNKETTQSKPFSINRGNLQDIYMKLKETANPNGSSFTQSEPTITNKDNWESVDIAVQAKDTSPKNNLNQNSIKNAEAEKTITGNSFNDIEDNQKLVNAVIWSEILGEPRSKKPYYAKDK
jgi:uncharacterized membrane protein YraQ (UPF0718 family)